MSSRISRNNITTLTYELKGTNEERVHDCLRVVQNILKTEYNRGDLGEGDKARINEAMSLISTADLHLWQREKA